MIKNKPIVVFVGTYPPRECGIATFTQDLLQSSKQFLGSHISCRVAALNLSPLDHYVYPPEVMWEVRQDNKQEYSELAQTLNDNPLVSGVILQHEYGIYGGDQGEHILAFVENCKKPLLVTLHTVLPAPSEKMKELTGRIIKRASNIVVLTESSREILAKTYPYSIGKVYVIPHGIHDTEFSSTEKAKKKLKLGNTTVLSTFGLLSRGKGIEYVINALPAIIAVYPSVHYLILGQTHPTVRRAEGEKYRLELAALVTKLGLKKHVKFYDQYHDLDDLIEFLKATDIYISTSINPDQAVSGTLSYALGTGRAVVSTAFTQAREIITPATGRLVAIKDSAAISIAVKDILSDPAELLQMHQNAYEATRPMLWSHVAEEYSDLLTQLVLPPIDLRYLKKMTDEFGLFQFATFDTPNQEFGYTLDDNARALVVCVQLIAQNSSHKNLEALLNRYLKFITYCQKEDGSFINYIGYNPKTPTAQNNDEDLSDAAARALWAVAEVMRNEALPKSARELARKVFLRAQTNTHTVTHLRSQAFMIKALVAAHEVETNKTELHQHIETAVAHLAHQLESNTHDGWHWFEEQLGYNNAVLSEALILGGAFLKNETFLKLGVSSLEFLIAESFSTNMYAPIGHSQWYKRDGERSYFDQQPEDPAAMIMALKTAFKYTGHSSYKNLAQKCFSWFLGNNSLHKPLYNYETAGCFDGLHPDRVNQNQGAESLISYLLARLAITEINA